MTSFWIDNFRLVAGAAAVLFVTGLYCILLSRNLIRILIGVELLTKAVTLLLVLAGAVTGRLATVQSLVITLIVVEVVVIMAGAGIVIGSFRHHGTLSTDPLREMKG